MQCLNLAGFKLRLEGYRLDGTFEVFEEADDGSAPDLTAEVVADHDYTALYMPDARYKTVTESSILLQNDERLAFTCSNDLFACVEYSADYTWARHYFNFKRYQDLSSVQKEMADFHFFLELRRQMIGYLFRRGDLILHSVSVLYKGEAVALSASSGTGKSTHGRLWVNHFGARILNGDLNACRIIDEKHYLYGLPWCGSSGITCNERAPLRAVVFLEQASVNEVRRLSPDEATLRLTTRSYLPKWDACLMSRDYFKPAESLAAAVPCYVFKCKPDWEAAEVLKKCLY